MHTKTKITVRLDDELLKILKAQSTNNLTAQIELMIMKGLLVDLVDLEERAELTEKLKIAAEGQLNNFEKETKTALIFLQEIVFKMALKQGFDENELKKLYQAIQSQHNQN